MESDSIAKEVCSAIDTVTASFATTRETLLALRSKPQILDTKDGISLLSLKHYALLSYLQSLVILSSRRVLGHSLKDRSLPSQPFSSSQREARGSDAGDLVDSMVESRVVLEKIGTLESRMKYQIEKLVRWAEEPENHQRTMHDPLAFRPNPRNLTNDKADEDVEETTHQNLDDDFRDTKIYRPPRLAPMPYNEKSKGQSRKDRPPPPSALVNLSSDLSRPHVETTSGLGGALALNSGRAAHLKRIRDFEEENFSRVMMKKKDARQRARDEEALALGGDLSGMSGKHGRRMAGGLEDEFGDVLKTIDRVRSGHGQDDGYEDLRRKGKKKAVLERSRQSDVRSHDDAFRDDGEQLKRQSKRTRFDLEAKATRKKRNRKLAG